MDFKIEKNGDRVYFDSNCKTMVVHADNSVSFFSGPAGEERQVVKKSHFGSYATYEGPKGKEQLKTVNGGGAPGSGGGYTLHFDGPKGEETLVRKVYQNSGFEEHFEGNRDTLRLVRCNTADGSKKWFYNGKFEFGTGNLTRLVKSVELSGNSRILRYYTGPCRKERVSYIITDDGSTHFYDDVDDGRLIHIDSTISNGHRSYFEGPCGFEKLVMRYVVDGGKTLHYDPAGRVVKIEYKDGRIDIIDGEKGAERATKHVFTKNGVKIKLARPNSIPCQDMPAETHVSETEVLPPNVAKPPLPRVSAFYFGPKKTTHGDSQSVTTKRPPDNETVQSSTGIKRAKVEDKRDVITVAALKEQPAKKQLFFKVPETANAGDRITFTTSIGSFGITIPKGASPGKLLETYISYYGEEIVTVDMSSVKLNKV